MLTIRTCSLAVVLIAGVAVLGPRQVRAAGFAGSPCADSLFVAYRAQPADSLTPSEFRYLMRREMECARYQERARANDGLEPMGPKTRRFLVGFGLTLAMGLVVYLTVH